MDKILLQLERLQRHYDHSVKAYDEVSLLDLAHALRIWADLKLTLPKSEPRFLKTRLFKSAVAPRKVMKGATGNEYVFAYMADGVVTYASDGHFFESPDHGGDLTLSGAVMIKEDNSILLKNFCATKGVALGEENIKIMNSATISRGNYVEWMGSEVARVCYPDESGALHRVAITREMLIRRVANTMDASHPSGATPSDGEGNRFDPAVQYLTQFKVGGIGLHYFILLKTAQDLVEIASHLLAGKSE